MQSTSRDEISMEKDYLHENEEIGNVVSQDDVNERTPILGGEGHVPMVTETIVYTRRYYILFAFCLTSFNTAMIWNTWGPVTESVKAVFGWDDSDIGMLANYGYIFFTLSVMFMSFLMDTKGLRAAVLNGTFLIMIGTVIRCFSLKHTIAKWMASICAALNGVGGTVPMAGVALVSSAWFPPHQRATATGAITFSNNFGLAMSFIIGPQLVSSPSNRTKGNGTGFDSYQLLTDQQIGDTYKNITNIPQLTTDIRNLLYLYAGLCVLAFLLALIYFPSRPPKPPSITASLVRENYLKGLVRLLSSVPVWLCALAYGIPTGVVNVWSGVLDVNLNPLGIHQKTVGYIGFWQTIAGCTTCLVVSRFSDLFMRRMKIFLIVMMSCGVVSCLWFLLLCEKYIPFNLPSVYASCILIGMCVNGSIPLFYEMTCEASYPVGEGITGGFLTLINNIVGVCFLFMLLIKNIGTAWMNWVILGATMTSIPLLVLFPERYRRTDLDISATPGQPHPGAPDPSIPDPSIQGVY